LVVFNQTSGYWNHHHCREKRHSRAGRTSVGSNCLDETLNKVGQDLGSLEEVSAMTDVTGFGLAGTSHRNASG
jgi:selenophosphate synthase